jgi:hypothetical protein
MPTMQQDTAKIAAVLTLPRAGRTALWGMTGSGKTILSDQLRRGWMQAFPSGKCLIIDSKPHYRAQWLLSGFTAAPLYKKWDTSNPHDFLPGSIVLPEMPTVREIRQAFKKSRLVLAQGPRAQWASLLSVLEIFYNEYSNRQGPRLVDIDEGADFFEIQARGGPILQALRAGRQLGLGVMLGSQRPVFLPKALLTESDRFYVLKLKNEDDVKTLQRNGGLPKDVQIPAKKYQFRYYDFTNEDWPSGELFQLAGV